MMYAFFRKGIFSSVNPTLWPREETQGRHKKIFLYTFQFYYKIFSFEKKIRVVNPNEKVSTLTPTFLHLSIRLKQMKVSLSTLFLEISASIYKK